MHELLGGCTSRIGVKTPWTLIFMRNSGHTHNIAGHCEEFNTSEFIHFRLCGSLIFLHDQGETSSKPFIRDFVCRFTNQHSTGA